MLKTKFNYDESNETKYENKNSRYYDPYYMHSEALREAAVKVNKRFIVYHELNLAIDYPIL